MYDEDKVESLGVGDAIEDEHRLDGEMPRPGTVRGGHDDGYGAYDERHEGARQAKMGGEVEAEEGEVVVNEIAEPDADGEKEKQGDVLHVFQRSHALPDAVQGGLHLVVD